MRYPVNLDVSSEPKLCKYVSYIGGNCKQGFIVNWNQVRHASRWRWQSRGGVSFERYNGAGSPLNDLLYSTNDNLKEL